MGLIDADMVLKDIKDLQESPWHNNGANSDSLCLQNQYVGRKEAVEIVRDLCIVKAKEVQAIPLDKVKQAREEMKECSYSLRCFNEDVFDEDERVVDLDNVLIILDKLIESEE